jgi:hypothetical protein
METLPPKLAKFLPVEPIIHGDCEKFVKWAEKDGSGGRSITLSVLQTNLQLTRI